MMTRKDLDKYDRIVVAFSGGKDSLACILHLLDLGVPAEKIELWHHDVDGREGVGGAPLVRLMDWPITPGYCRAVAAHLGLRLCFNWKVGGFFGEMTRDGRPTAPTRFEMANGEIGQAGGKGPDGTRLKFPQVAADLSVRWCSAYLKIDVAAIHLRNDPAYQRGHFLFVTGERGEESPGRSRYLDFEPHRASCGARVIEHWRPVLRWTEHQVWAIIERHQINPHPCYWLGWGRASCLTCIFGQDDQWASALQVAPEMVHRVAAWERTFGRTIARGGVGVLERAARGRSFVPPGSEKMIDVSQGEMFDLPIQMEPWVLPPGAYRTHGGPV